MFAAESYDPETLSIMTRAFDEAWVDVQGMLGKNPINATSLRSVLAKRIMAAAEHGERDPKRLKLVALRAIEP